ncbi:MAG: sigma 54-interacting transcriptional regulator [Enterocloster sp.]
MAHKGTIFLDEINSMPIELQSVLLRTIQEKEIRRVGAQKNIYVDIRIISACNKNMEELIADGKFRADLYYRLNTLKLTMPDLEQKEDIPPLCRYFLKRYSAKYSVSNSRSFSEERVSLLKRSWPGNVRGKHHAPAMSS